MDNKINVVCKRVYTYLSKQFSFIDDDFLQNIIINSLNNDTLKIKDELEIVQLLLKESEVNIYKHLNDQFESGNFVTIIKEIIESITGNRKVSFKEIEKINNIIVLSKYVPSFNELESVGKLDNIKSFLDNLNSTSIDIESNYFLSLLIDVNSKNDDLSNKIEEFNFCDEYTTDPVQAYFRDINNIPKLSEFERDELINKMRNGDLNARNRFLEDNLLLVVSIAKRYINKTRTLSFIDLIQEGSEGLINASNKYDPNKGKFSTYATWYIRQKIQSAVTEDRMIKIPRNESRFIKKYKYEYIQLRNLLGRYPSILELAAHFNISEKEAIDIYNLLFDTISLDSKINDDSDNTLNDFLENKNMHLENDCIIKYDTNYLLENSNLSDKEKDILRKIYYDGMTQEKIGKIYGCTKKNISRIKSDAIKKIQKSQLVLSYADYMDYPDRVSEYVKSVRYK